MSWSKLIVSEIDRFLLLKQKKNILLVWNYSSLIFLVLIKTTIKISWTILVVNISVSLLFLSTGNININVIFLSAD